MNDALDVVTGDVWVRDGRIAAVGDSAGGGRARRHDDRRRRRTRSCPASSRRTSISARRCSAVWPTTCRCSPGCAQRVWPLEAAHDDATLAAAARLAAAELLLGGTTSVLTMETVHDTDAVFDALVPTGLRAVVGKCLMDVRGDAPARLLSGRATALDESLALHRRWHGAAERPAARGARAALCASRARATCSKPRRRCRRERGLLVHTHASEQRDEVALVRAATGLDNIAYLASVGLATSGCARRTACGSPTPSRRCWPSGGVQGAALPRLESEARDRASRRWRRCARAASPCRSAPTAPRATTRSTCFRRCGSRRRCRRCVAAPARCRRATSWHGHAREARARSASTARSARSRSARKPTSLSSVTTSCTRRPAADPYSTLVYASRPSDVRATIVDGEIVARDGALTWADVTGRARRCARGRAHARPARGI